MSGECFCDYFLFKDMLVFDSGEVKDRLLGNDRRE